MDHMKNIKEFFIENCKIRPNFCEISTVDLSYAVTFNSTVEISQNFAGFSEYMNFMFDIGVWCFKYQNLFETAT